MAGLSFRWVKLYIMFMACHAFDIGIDIRDLTAEQQAFECIRDKAAGACLFMPGCPLRIIGTSENIDW
jgi:hypothetical protein